MEVDSETKSVTVTRTVAHPLRAVWDVLMKPHGAGALLGDGAELGTKGVGWQAADGTYGVTRSFHPLEQLRFSWHAHEDAPATMIDLHLRDRDGHTELELVHEHLPADADTGVLAAKWDAALERIASQAL